MADFPPIDPRSLAPLRILMSQLVENPDLLDAPECPYPADLKAFLARLGPKKERKDGPFTSGKGSKWTVLESETIELYEDLKAFGEGLAEIDATEKMSFFRTSTALLDKLIGLNERALGLKRIHEFQETVLNVIDSTLTPSQRTEVMRKLRQAIDPDANTEQS